MIFLFNNVKLWYQTPRVVLRFPPVGDLVLETLRRVVLLLGLRIPPVRPQVFRQGRLFHKGSSAFPALVRPLPRVGAVMLHQVRFLDKAPDAQVTLVGSLPRVDSQMFYEH